MRITDAESDKDSDCDADHEQKECCPDLLIKQDRNGHAAQDERHTDCDGKRKGTFPFQILLDRFLRDDDRALILIFHILIALFIFFIEQIIDRDMKEPA